MFGYTLPLEDDSVFVRVDGDAAPLFRQAKQRVAHVVWRGIGRNGDGNENVVVLAVSGHGMRTVTQLPAEILSGRRRNALRVFRGSFPRNLT